jgi:hypothetical protein
MLPLVGLVFVANINQGLARRQALTYFAGASMTAL